MEHFLWNRCYVALNWKAELVYMQLYGLKKKILIQDTIGQFLIDGTNDVWHWYGFDFIAVHKSDKNATWSVDVGVLKKWLLSVLTRKGFSHTVYVPLEDVILIFKGKGSSDMH